MSFFFSCYGDHRYLHSFPTRRSSDLMNGPSAHAEESCTKRAMRSFPVPLSPVIRTVDSTLAIVLARSTTCRISGLRDRKSTRLNSSHTVISYAVFCLKKKNKNDTDHD